MKTYRVITTLGFSLIYNWTALEVGAKSIEGVPMLQSEYDTFKDMVDYEIYKNIEPGRVFEILN